MGLRQAFEIGSAAAGRSAHPRRGRPRRRARARAARGRAGDPLRALKVALDSAAAGLRGPFDVVDLDFGDEAGLEEQCRLARSLGFRGKACIHPAQVETINRVFAPSEGEIEWARARGRGVRGPERGRARPRTATMIDLPVVERARRILGGRTRCSDGDGAEGVAGPLLRGLRGRRRLPQPLRPHDHGHGQHLVHLPDDEHEPVHFNVPYAERTQFGQPLVNSAFTLALVTGLTVPDTSENAAANLAWTDIKLPKPVFVGDTLWAESEITRPARVEVEPERRHRLDALPRHQPAPRGRDRVQADVHGLQARRPRGAATRFPGPTTTGRCEMTAAAEARRVRDDARRSTTSRRRWSRHAKLHLLDTLGCGLAAHALGIATRGPDGDGRARRRAAGDGDRPRRAAARRRTRRSRTRCSATGSTSTTRTPTRSATSRTVTCPAVARRRARRLGAGGREVLAAIVAGNEIIDAARHGRLGRASTRAASTRRRSAGSSAPPSPAARLTGGDDAHDGERARHRRLDGVGPLRLPRGRHGDEADPPGLGRARRHPRRAARRARRRGPADGARGQLRPLPRLPRRGAGRDRHRRRSSPTSARAGRRRASRTSPIPVCHFMHGSLGATADALRRADALAGRDRGDRRHRPGGRRLARARAGGREEGAALGLRGQVLLQYSVAAMLVHGHVGVGDLLGRGDRRPGRPRPSRRRSGTRRRTTRPTRRRSRAASASRCADGSTLEARLPAPAGRPREPDVGRRGRARSSATNAVARARRRRPSTRSRRPSSRSRSRTTSRPRSRRSPAARSCAA